MDYLQQLQGATPQISGTSQPDLLQLQRAMGLLDSVAQALGVKTIH